MEIPDFWAEARLVGEVDGRRRVVRRQGWSEQSPLEAQAHAEARARLALDALRAGEQVPSIEGKRVYGEDGMPIREQVLVRTAEMVVTRNQYGAQCLNVADVLFADVDLTPSLSPAGEFFWNSLQQLTGVGALTIALLQFGNRSWGQGCLWLLGTCASVVVLSILHGLLARGEKAMAAHKRRTHMKIAAVAGTEGLLLALYETKKGYRVLALNRTFDPVAEETQQLFRAMGTDANYAQLCALQRCFRARLTAKPWRVGMQRPPSRAVWPLTGERLADLNQWVSDYEQAAGIYAACRHIQDLGEGELDPRCAQVQGVHDELSRARSDLPLA